MALGVILMLALGKFLPDTFQTVQMTGRTEQYLIAEFTMKVAAVKFVEFCAPTR